MTTRELECNARKAPQVPTFEEDASQAESPEQQVSRPTHTGSGDMIVCRGVRTEFPNPAD